MIDEAAPDTPYVRAIQKRLELLQHMLGATSQKRPATWGERNYFCAEIGSEDHTVLVSMVEEDLVQAGGTINEGTDQYFFATRAGAQAIGMSKAAIGRMIDRQRARTKARQDAAAVAAAVAAAAEGSVEPTEGDAV